MKCLTTLAVLITVALLSGCPSTLTGDSYSREDARNVQTVQTGTITYLRPVQIEGTKTPVGAGAGAIVGGVAGSSVGSGTGSVIAATVGAVAGGLAGAAAEEQMTKTQGVEVTVRLDGSNQSIAVVQEATPNDMFRIGDHVRLMSVNGQTRVTK